MHRCAIDANRHLAGLSRVWICPPDAVFDGNGNSLVGHLRAALVVGTRNRVQIVSLHLQEQGFKRR